MRFWYSAVNDKGKKIRGSVESGTPSEAAAYLHLRKLTPIKIYLENENKLIKKLTFRKKVKTKDLVLFTRQISSMLTSGLTLIKSLEILKDQISNNTLKEIIGGILIDLQEGSTFSSSISKYPEIFPKIYVSLVKAGEESGLLDKIFMRLAINLEKQQKLRSKVKSALSYPIIIFVLMFLVISLMMIFVVPQLSKLYDSLGVELPLVTKIVLAMSGFMGKFWPFMIGVFLIIFYAFKRWKSTEKGKEKLDRFKLNAPLFGKIIKQSILAEFSRTFGLLVGTGTLVMDALDQSMGVTGNVIYERAINDIKTRVEKGISVGEAMSMHSEFPPLLVQLVKVGEETGKMDENLMKASEYFEEEVEQSVKTLTTSMEPLIMIVLGIGVGFLVFSVITPIYSLMSAIDPN